MADMGAWYYAAGGGQKGPVSLEQMRALVSAGAVDGDTLVWSQGMSDWTALARTPLSSLLRTEPPPPPPMPPRPPERPADPPPAAVERMRGPAPQPQAWSPPPPAAQPSYGAPQPTWTPPPAAAAPMGMGGAISACFSKYATFSGRARRAEFWYFYLFMMVIHVVLAAAAQSTLGSAGDLDTYYGIVSIEGVFGLVMLLPMLSVTVRRLHDTDRSGWWYWLALIPAIGVIVLIIFLAERGTPGDNRYGPPTV